MAIVEIQLNRLGINSLELSTDAVDVSAGTALHIRFVNYGSPTHATLRCDAPSYTDFTYENIYVEGESELEIRIRGDAEAGNFDMQVITGYGMRREAFTIHVLKPCPALELDLATSKESISEQKKSPFGEKTVVNFTIPIIASIIIALWWLRYLDIDEHSMVIVVYLTMLSGIIISWRSEQ